jgi:L-2-hydroxyglutarate oxidase LhgO
MQKVDCLIVGGGIVGVAVARHLQSTFSNLKCLLVEKENILGEKKCRRKKMKMLVFVI